MMLKAENRLRRKKDFDWVFKHSKPIYCGNLALRASPARSDFKNPKRSAGPRFGFIIGTKIEKKAVRRNRIKRCLRQAVSEFLNKTKPNLDIIIIVKKNYPYPFNYNNIKKDYEELIARID